eukprot:g1568.t1
METSSIAQRVIFKAPFSPARFHSSRARSVSRTNCRASNSNEVSNLATVVAISTSMYVASVMPIQAAEEVMQLAAQDNRFGAITFVFVPAIAWVLFNILGPASRQMEAMTAGQPKKAVPRATNRAPAIKKAPVKRAPVKKPVLARRK